MLDIIAKPVEALVSGVVGWFTSRQKLKEVELQSKIEVAKARAAAKIDVWGGGRYCVGERLPRQLWMEG